MDVKGTVALITGGASGLGAATAKRLFDAGASVVLIDLPSSAGAAYAAELNACGRRRRRRATGRFRSRGRYQRSGGAGRRRHRRSARAAADRGQLRGHCHPGKVLGRDGVLPLDVFNRVIQVNLIGTFNVLRLAAAAMVATEPVTTDLGGPERGVIVNTASVAAFDGQIGQPAYAASKGAVAAMTLPLARELARSLVRVVTIAPGIFETPMMATLPAGRAGFAGPAGPAPVAAWQACRIRQPGGPHRGQRHDQRRNHPAGRRHPDGPEMNGLPEPPTFSLSSPCSIRTEQAKLAELREFLATEIAPHASDWWNKAEFPAHILPKLAALELSTPAQRGYSNLFAGLVIAEMTRVDTSIATFFLVHHDLFVESLYGFGSAEPKGAAACGRRKPAHHRRLRPHRTRPWFRCCRRDGDPCAAHLQRHGKARRRRRRLGAQRRQALDRERDVLRLHARVGQGRIRGPTGAGGSGDSLWTLPCRG